MTFRTRCVRPLALVLLLVLLLALPACQRVGGEAFQETFNQPLALTNEVTVGQTFRPATDGVAGVNVLLATYGTRPDPAGTLSAVLRDALSGQQLAHVALPGDALGDNEWAPIRFAQPVPAPAVAALELTWDGGPGVAVWADAPLPQPVDGFLNDPYPGGELLLGGRPAPGDLAFRVVGTGGAGALPRTLREIAGRGVALLVGDREFALAWVAALTCAAGLALVGLWPARQLRERRPRQQRGQHEERRPAQADELDGEDGRVEHRVTQAR